MKLLVCDGGKRKEITYGSFKAFDRYGNEDHHEQFIIGHGTPNLAEYESLIRALNWALTNNEKYVKIFTDSKLIVNQINGTYACNYKHLRHARDRARKLLKGFESYSFEWVDNHLIKIILGH